MPVPLLELIKETKLADEVEALKSLRTLATNWDDLSPHFGNISDITDVLSLVKALAQKKRPGN